VDLLKLKHKINESGKRRNIFSWEIISKRTGETEEKGNIKTGRKPFKKESDTESNLLLDIKYVGFVFSGEKIVGIIVFGKEEFIIKEGDTIENIGKVKKITPKEIEIILNNSKIIKIPIQEEEEYIF
jgi:Tfp pilus assembly protein PilP